MTAVQTRPVPTDFAAARRAMIDSQLRTSGVSDAFVIERMRDVPREEHVSAASRAVAYIDRSIALDNGGKIAPPLFYGALLREARPDKGDEALVVDGGSGYLPALLEPLVGKMKVVSPEEAVGGLRGKFSLILVDGAIEHFPASLEKRLDSGGRVVAGLVRAGVTRLAVGREAGGAVGWLRLAEMGIPRLAQFDEPKRWSF